MACLIGGWVLVSFHSKEFETVAERLLKQYDMKLVFTDEKYYKDRPEYIKLDQLLNIISNCDHKQISDNTFGFDDEDTFTIIYTSGTTGVPKALEINLQGVNNFINGFFEIFEFNSNDKVFIFLPLSVLTCRAYIYAAIMRGTNVLLANMDTFLLAMKIEKPTVLQGVPHLFETVYDTVNNMLMADPKKKGTLDIFLALNSRHLIPKALANKFQHKYLKPFLDFWGGNMRLMITGSASIGKKILYFYNNAGIPLFEAYGINEGGVLAINSPGNNRVGSVGKPFMGRSIKIAQDGEVLVKRDKYTFSNGYYDEELNKNNNVFLDNGYIATGDIGYFDKDGFLYINGRKKEIITLSNGEKIMPAKLENKIKESPLIKQVCLYGNEKPFITGIITASDKTITGEKLLDEIHKMCKEEKELSKIRAVIVTKEPFTVENKLINVNMKLARKEIYKYYHDELVEQYC